MQHVIRRGLLSLSLLRDKYNIDIKANGLQESPGGVGFFFVGKRSFPPTACIVGKSVFSFFFSLHILSSTLHLKCYLTRGVREKTILDLTL